MNNHSQHDFGVLNQVYLLRTGEEDCFIFGAHDA